ncbi:MAG: hypothetical protein RBT41_05550 [Clostridia bacterium]|jgi:hypothetical protein|nr:hypothetical protein [Clostridia bacterium]
MPLFKNTEKRCERLSLPPLVLSVWSPLGRNTAAFSLELSAALSAQTRVFLAETACHGIPRLAFAADIMDREKNMDALILQYEKTGEINFALTHTKSRTLAVSAASAYASPDYPVPSRVELETLVKLPAQLINTARQNGYPLIVFECQGQLSNPLTFFAVKHSDYVFLPAEERAEIAVILINLKKLIQAFKYTPEMFKVVAKKHIEEIQEIMHIAEENGSTQHRIEVLPQNSGSIAEQLALWKKAEAQEIYGEKGILDTEIRIRL